MTELKPCPCGAIPTALSALFVMDGDQGGKYAFAYGSCCGEWHVKFRTDYKDIASSECVEKAIAAWNLAPRNMPDVQARIAELEHNAVIALNEADYEYNKKTNAMIEQHANQLAEITKDAQRYRHIRSNLLAGLDRTEDDFDESVDEDIAASEAGKEESDE